MEEEKSKKTLWQNIEDTVHETLECFGEVKTKNSLPWFSLAFLLYSSIHTYEVRKALDYRIERGREQGISLMEKIYNTQGSNEPLRYKCKNYDNNQ